MYVRLDASLAFTLAVNVPCLAACTCLWPGDAAKLCVSSSAKFCKLLQHHHHRGLLRLHKCDYIRLRRGLLQLRRLGSTPSPGTANYASDTCACGTGLDVLHARYSGASVSTTMRSYLHPRLRSLYNGTTTRCRSNFSKWATPPGDDSPSTPIHYLRVRHRFDWNHAPALAYSDCHARSTAESLTHSGTTVGDMPIGVYP
jgi:hypothetical protein